MGSCCFTQIMEQIEGGTLIVNSGTGEKKKESEVGDEERDLNTVEGLAEGWKLAEASPSLTASYHRASKN